jgi:hypothetical protein
VGKKKKMSDNGPCNCEQVLKLLGLLKQIIRIHDGDWSDKYRETGLASDMADIAREAVDNAGGGN